MAEMHAAGTPGYEAAQAEMRKRRDAIRDAQVAEARRACGCGACRGGVYDFGALGLNVPGSCVAATLLAFFLEKRIEP